MSISNNNAVGSSVSESKMIKDKSTSTVDSTTDTVTVDSNIVSMDDAVVQQDPKLKDLQSMAQLQHMISRAVPAGLGETGSKILTIGTLLHFKYGDEFADNAAVWLSFKGAVVSSETQGLFFIHTAKACAAGAAGAEATKPSDEATEPSAFAADGSFTHGIAIRFYVDKVWRTNQLTKLEFELTNMINSTDHKTQVRAIIEAAQEFIRIRAMDTALKLGML